MKKLVILISAALVITACKKEKEVTNTKENDSIGIEKSITGINIEAFGFPDGVNNCSCYFATSKEEFEKENYVYADDLGASAQLKINGAMLKLDLISSTDMDSEDEMVKEMQNENYTVSIKGKKIKSNNEAMMFEGTMTVENVNGEKATTPIYGECGC